MIGYLRGKVLYRGAGWIILTIQESVGYKIYTNMLTKEGAMLALYIHHVVREDASDLYGFYSLEELAFFEQLLLVSGVGPKVALAIVSSGSIDKIKQAIIKGDSTALTVVGGVGKKVAAKIIIELKGKLSGESGSLLPEEGGEKADLVEALGQLGYKQTEIIAVIRELPENLDGIQAKLTWALQRIRK